MDASATARCELELGRLRALRDQAAEVMLALDQIGLHEAAGHVSMSLMSIDEAASRPAVLPQGTVH
jgi:hypothetical protein